MAGLTSERCVACRPDSPRVTEAEVAELHPQTPDWQLVTRDGILRLERVFRFPDFVRALAFTDRAGALAEAEGHHPALLTEWGRVTVTWWTHAIRGLHRNDFVMAAKTDALYRAATGSSAPGPRAGCRDERRRALDSLRPGC
jgi:4a-hydroxytetrahydrobiopterin dehydratase